MRIFAFRGHHNPDRVVRTALALLGFWLAVHSEGCRLTDSSQSRQVARESERNEMASLDTAQSHLQALIQQGRGFEAETLGRELGTKADPVLDGLWENSSAKIRRTVLEVASQAKTPGSSRIVLRGLDDPDPEVSELCKYLVGICTQPEVLPDLLKAMEKHRDPSVRSMLALQIGRAGSKTEIPKLQLYQKTAKDPELLRNLDLALARLGEPEARNVLISRIYDNDDSVRFKAVQDCLYVNDRSIVEHFQPVLTDYRDAILLTIPEDREQIYARICDAGVMAMANLGYAFSFSGTDLRRFSAQELKEAERLVPKPPSPSGQIR